MLGAWLAGDWLAWLRVGWRTTLARLVRAGLHCPHRSWVGLARLSARSAQGCLAVDGGGRIWLDRCRIWCGGEDFGEREGKGERGMREKEKKKEKGEVREKKISGFVQVFKT